MPPESFFLPVGDGQRFCLFHPAQVAPLRGRVLYLHPFAQEMNKARRMAALQSRALARAGYAVLQMDLLGCGDSSGDFGDATWERWVGDVLQGVAWLHQRCGGAGQGEVPLWLWGLRAGCLLAVAAAPHLEPACNFLFWQPPASGKPMLQQFLRLKVAGDMLGGNAKASTELLRHTLARGEPVEIAGYLLDAELARGLDEAGLVPPLAVATARRLVWLEVSTRPQTSVGVASAQVLAQWQHMGWQVDSEVLVGPAFWQTTEIEDAPALVDATVAALAQGDA